MLTGTAKIPDLKSKLVTKRNLCQNLVVNKYANDSVKKVESEQSENCKGIVMSKNVSNLSKKKYIIPDKRLVW